MAVAQFDPRPLSEVFSELSQQLSTLVRQEAALARTEFTATLKGFMRDAMVFGIVAALGLVALVLTGDALVLLLVAAGLGPWLATIVVAGVLGVTALALAQWRINAARHRRVTPVETVDELKETAQWLKNETTGAGVRR